MKRVEWLALGRIAVLGIGGLSWAGGARADLLPGGSCTTCSGANPLSLVSGSVYAHGTDGEAITTQNNSITWGPGYTNNLLGGNISVSNVFPTPPNQDVVRSQSSATLQVGPPYSLPAITATASSVDSNPFGLVLGGSSAGGGIDYQVEVIRAGQAATFGLAPRSYSCGPAPVTCSLAPADPPDGTPVRIDVSGLIEGSGLSFLAPNTDGATGYGNIVVSRDSDGAVLAQSQLYGGIGSVPFNATISMLVGTVYDVELDANVSTTGTGTGSILVDPSFSIDGADPNVGNVTLLFSNGLNAAAPADGSGTGSGSGPSPTGVPEPSSVFMILVSLVLIGLSDLGVARRRFAMSCRRC